MQTAVVRPLTTETARSGVYRDSNSFYNRDWKLQQIEISVLHHTRPLTVFSFHCRWHKVAVGFVCTVVMISRSDCIYMVFRSLSIKSTSSLNIMWTYSLPKHQIGDNSGHYMHCKLRRKDTLYSLWTLLVVRIDLKWARQCTPIGLCLWRWPRWRWHAPIHALKQHFSEDYVASLINITLR